MTDDRTPRRPSSQEDDRKSASEWSRYSQLVFEYLGYLLVLGYGGYWLDQRNDWNGRALLGGLILATITWVYRVLRVTRGLFK